MHNKNTTRKGIIAGQVLERWTETGPEWLKEVADEVKPSRLNTRRERGQKYEQKKKNRYNWWGAYRSKIIDLYALFVLVYNSTMKTQILTWIAFNTLSWLAFSFVNWNLNPADWEQNVRFFYAILALCSALPILSEKKLWILDRP